VLVLLPRRQFYLYFAGYSDGHLTSRGKHITEILFVALCLTTRKTDERDMSAQECTLPYVTVARFCSPRTFCGAHGTLIPRLPSGGAATLLKGKSQCELDLPRIFRREDLPKRQGLVRERIGQVEIRAIEHVK
jgi:hypothetical protein